MTTLSNTRASWASSSRYMHKMGDHESSKSPPAGTPCLLSSPLQARLPRPWHHNLRRNFSRMQFPKLSFGHNCVLTVTLKFAYMVACCFAALQARSHIPPSAFPDWQRPCFIFWSSISATLRSSESGNQGEDGQPNPPALTTAVLPVLAHSLSYTITVDQA